MRGRWITGAIAACALLPGCATEQGYLSLAATEPVSLDVRELDVDRIPAVRDVEGRHTAVTSVLFVPTFTGPRLDAAVEDALAKGHGDVLTRARVHTRKFWLLVGVETLTVRGTVVDLPERR
ncbi:MAG: hypothetical protein DCC71_16160 [Proteobacteria bacterium]|nr:MAG: hypothetical protein DCC71_16160 [Pseudomonadota bacterium]